MTSHAPGTKAQDDPHDTEGSSGAPAFRRVSLEAVAGSSAVALGWVLMAITHPTTTYHFAPLVAVVVVPFLARARTQKSIPLRRALVLTSGGALPALIATAVIESLNALGGPTLISAGGALVETLIAIGAGLLIGMTAMISPWRRGGSHLKRTAGGQPKDLFQAAFSRLWQSCRPDRRRRDRSAVLDATEALHVGPPALAAYMRLIDWFCNPPVGRPRLRIDAQMSAVEGPTTSRTKNCKRSTIFFRRL